MGSSFIFQPPKQGPVPSWVKAQIFYINKAKFQNPDKFSKSFSGFCCSERNHLRKVPYLHLTQTMLPKPTKYLIIYFHGTSELITDVYRTLERYHAVFEIDVICPEYPGYGYYSEEKPSEDIIIEDAVQIIRNAVYNLGYKEQNIILVGRSLGSSVAVQMGTIFSKLRGIVLISAFRSIKRVVEKTGGRFAAVFAPDIFRTEDFIETLRSPTLFIHGMQDKLVSWEDSQYLHDNCGAPASIVINRDMDHNNFNIKKDIFIPMLKFFLEKLDITDLQATPIHENLHKASILSTLEGLPYLAFSVFTGSTNEDNPDQGRVNITEF